MENNFISKFILQGMEKDLQKDTKRVYKNKNIKKYIQNNEKQFYNLIKKLVQVKLSNDTLRITKKQNQKLLKNTEILEKQENYIKYSSVIDNTLQVNYNKYRYNELVNFKNVFLYDKYKNILNTKDKNKIKDFKQKLLQKQVTYTLNARAKTKKIPTKEYTRTLKLKLKKRDKKRVIKTYKIIEQNVFRFLQKNNIKNNIKKIIERKQNNYFNISILNLENYIQNAIVTLLENKQGVFINTKNQLYISKYTMYKIFRNIRNSQYKTIKQNKKECSFEYYNKFTSVNNKVQKNKKLDIKKVLNNIKFSQNEQKIITTLLNNNNYNLYKTFITLGLNTKHIATYKNRIAQKIINYCTSNKITLNNMLKLN